MAVCGACAATMTAAKAFCTSCGFPMRAGCPACGEPVEPAERFCGACGSALDELSAPPGAPAQRARSLAVGPQAASATERRQVTVLFCDLVDYTSLAEGRDPEDVLGLLSGYFELARSIVARHGGVVEKFVGDAVMARWGAPVATEDDVERAVRAGLELVSAIPAFGNEHLVALSARVGVSTGHVATAERAEMWLVVGDRVNTAARIEAAAGPGTCVVDETTRRLAASAVAFSDLGLHQLKGKASPEPLYVAERVLSGVGGRQRRAVLEPPLIARDHELHSLKDLFHQSIEEDSSRLVVLSGPAGVGKSRLGWELEKYTDGLSDAVLFHRGGCRSYGEGVAFWPLADIVRQRLSIAEEDPLEVAASKLSKGLVSLIDEQQRDDVEACLARLLGIESEQARAVQLTKEKLFAGWRSFFTSLSQSAPVVVVIEDAEHADGAMLDFLEHLIDWSRNAALFVLVLARTELTEARPDLGVGWRRSFVALEPLDSSATRQLVESLVPGVARPVAEVISKRANGIPLFAIETVRALVEAGTLVSDEGSYHLVGELGELQVPDSLHALLAARLDALGPPARALLGTASVLGLRFSAEALSAVAGEDLAQVRASLDELVRHDVLEIVTDPLSPQHGDYRFVLELLRQVTYVTLSRHERRARHLRVAAQLRAVFANDGEEIADLIARHYLDALDALPAAPNAGEIRAEALLLLVRAAERAGRTAAPSRAASSYAAAADLVRASPPGEADDDARAGRAAALYERAGLAANNAGEHASAIPYAERARLCYSEAGDRRGEARARALVGRALTRAGRLGEARAQLQAALEVLSIEPSADTARTLGDLAFVEGSDGHLELAGRLADEALEMGRALEVDAALMARLFHARALPYSRTDRLAEAAQCFREVIRLAERAGDTACLGTGLIGLSFTASDRAERVEAARAATEHARRLGHRAMLGVAVHDLACNLFELGEWDEIDSTIASAIENDGLDGDLNVLMVEVLLAAARGDGERATTVLARLSLSQPLEGVEHQANVAAFEALTAAARGCERDALAHAFEVIDRRAAIGFSEDAFMRAWPLAARIAAGAGDHATLTRLLEVLEESTSDLPPTLSAERELVRARMRAGDDDPEAGMAFASAITALRSLSSPYRLAWGLLDQAAWLAGSGELAAAFATADEARAIGARLACRPLLERAATLSTQLAGVAAGA